MRATIIASSFCPLVPFLLTVPCKTDTEWVIIGVKTFFVGVVLDFNAISVLWTRSFDLISKVISLYQLLCGVWTITFLRASFNGCTFWNHKIIEDIVNAFGLKMKSKPFIITIIWCVYSLKLHNNFYLDAHSLVVKFVIFRNWIFIDAVTSALSFILHKMKFVWWS